MESPVNQIPLSQDRKVIEQFARLLNERHRHSEDIIHRHDGLVADITRLERIKDIDEVLVVLARELWKERDVPSGTSMTVGEIFPILRAEYARLDMLIYVESGHDEELAQAEKAMISLGHFQEWCAAQDITIIGNAFADFIRVGLGMR